MKKIIIFNWKMYPSSLKEARQLLIYYKQPTTNDKKLEIVICPPFTYLPFVSSIVGRKSSVKLGSQNVFWESKGAYTGEISPTMLKNLGVEYVIVGHSERRQYLSETDEMINKKVLAALKAGLKIILCVGESSCKSQIANRKAQISYAKQYVKKQLQKDLKTISASRLAISNLIVAYEPVWAISTENGKSDTPEDALEMIKFIKKFLSVKCQVSSVKVLYGGSVDSKNIKNFVKYPEINGALVGGASLKINEVKKIISIIK